jgi:hypothetical protein
MIVSIAIAVLPVWRSPMISSRWPRPIGIYDPAEQRVADGDLEQTSGAAHRVAL